MRDVLLNLGRELMYLTVTPISFNADLRRLWTKGKLPTVKYGFYGDELTQENITREHLKPASLGGTRADNNIVLASRTKNNARGNSDICKFATKENATRYLDQFKNVRLPELNGMKYIKGIVERLKGLGFNF